MRRVEAPASTLPCSPPHTVCAVALEFTLTRYYLEPVAMADGMRELPREERVTYRHAPGDARAVRLPARALASALADHLSNEWIVHRTVNASWIPGTEGGDPLFGGGGAPPRRGVVYLNREQYLSAVAATAVGGI